MTSSEAIVQVLTGSRKAWSAVAIRDAALPLTTGLKGADPAHTLYMSLYKEARRPDGLVIRYQAEDGKTLFKLNPKRRELGAKKAAKAPAKAAAKSPAKKAAPRKRRVGGRERASPLRLPKRDPLHRSTRGRVARRRRGLNPRRRRRRDGRRGGGARDRRVACRPAGLQLPAAPYARRPVGPTPTAGHVPGEVRPAPA